MAKQKYPQTSGATTAEGVTKKGRAHYSHAKADARKAKKQEEAMVRQEKYDGLTTKEKITLAQHRRGENRRELTRLTKQLALEKTPTPKTPPLTVEQKAAKVIELTKNAVENDPGTKRKSRSKKS